MGLGAGVVMGVGGAVSPSTIKYGKGLEDQPCVAWSEILGSHRRRARGGMGGAQHRTRRGVIKKWPSLILFIFST